MRAAAHFIAALAGRGRLDVVHRVRVDLFGSLAATGRGHGTDKAVLAGLAGAQPETVDPDFLPTLAAEVAARHRLRLRTDALAQEIGFDPDTDLCLHPRERLSFHPNALTCTAYGPDGDVLLQETSYSIGGGAIVTEDDLHPLGRRLDGSDQENEAEELPYPFRTGTDLLAICTRAGLDIPTIMLANEQALGRDQTNVLNGLAGIWTVMSQCITDGCSASGNLPGGLGVRRRAPRLATDLRTRATTPDPLAGLEWVSTWAMAVNEQNAAGGRIVTAPTNGAAGIVPAVLNYALTSKLAVPRSTSPDLDPAAAYLLTCGAIGIIYRQTASISGAEVGCQGEIGVACSMAAAGLCHILGGTPQQICNAAEIGLEHHLGLTCDPVAGLVQVPCIERNAVGAVTAITAARLALAGDGSQLVSLDQVIATMMATGADMQDKYKETSRGGLAVNIPNC
jgi:L-serine dehydratase